MGLVSDSLKTLQVNDFKVDLSQRGEISTGIWKSGGSTISSIYLAGLWIGMEHNGAPEGNIISTKSIVRSNYTSKFTDKQIGVFSLNADNNYAVNDWPVDYGAPINNSGLPEIYGDEMCWTSLKSDTTIKNYSFLSRPISGLRVTQAVYGYKRDDLRNTIFIKYGITNLSTEDWNDVYIGFFSDTDLNNSFANKTGYDSARSLSYTYDTTSNYVTGFTFLETPQDVGIKSHRIMRKNNYIDPDFGEYSFTSPNQIIYTLKGLSNSGQPMINPVTGLITNFAFTGDPVSHTGWLDNAVDVRSIISSGSFSLNKGETTWVTVVWVINDGMNLLDSLTKLKSHIDQIKADIALWKFH
ncbi:MAG TPA: hypothetical protein VMT35_19490 [Ignavibacteriaceae bacterium]|nr:hypothetical protein [Ignavibacteriaceae bacterium]